MNQYTLYNVDQQQTCPGLSGLFPDWAGPDERLCVYSPHDDDAIIGAGYAMRAALDAGAEVHIFIVCSGNAGYSRIEMKKDIVAVRRRETLACYGAFGIPEENIVFLNYGDFTALNRMGLSESPLEGHMRTTLAQLRQRKITRILAPNHYREHIDHIATSLMASYDGPQCGDAIVVDWGAPSLIRSTAEYAVWADLDPEDALLKGRDLRLRANAVLIASGEVEARVCDSIRQYASQQEIIAGLIASRAERRLPDGRYIEVYLQFDPRPKLNFTPYLEAISSANA